MVRLVTDFTAPGLVLASLMLSGCTPDAAVVAMEDPPDTDPRPASAVDVSAGGGGCSLDARDRDMLAGVNAARARARQCGDEAFAAAPAVTWSCQLEQAAEAHSSDMGSMNFFSHTGSDGLQVWDRVAAAGYGWSAVGENIAAGQATVAAAMDGWLSSPGHCANIMRARFSEMGAAVAEPAGSDFARYWTQVFADPR